MSSLEGQPPVSRDVYLETGKSEQHGSLDLAETGKGCIAISKKSANEQELANVPAIHTSDDDAEEIQPSKILRFDEIFDTFETRRKLKKTFVPAAKKRQASAALAIRRVISFLGDYLHTNIDIKSEALHQVLLEINSDVKDLQIRMIPPVADPELFFYSLQGLHDRLSVEYAQVTRNKDLIGDVKAAILFAEEYHKDTIQTVRSLEASREISWDLLWTIFKPNTLMYSRNKVVDTDQILKLLHCKKVICKPHGGEHTRWVLTCQYFGVTASGGATLGSSRKKAGYCVQELEIKDFPGVKEVTDLEVYPLEYRNDKADLEVRLIDRGKKYTNMSILWYCQKDQTSIGGATTEDTWSPSLNRNDETSADDSHVPVHQTPRGSIERVMIDPAGCALYWPDCPYAVTVTTRVNDHAINNEDRLICSPMVFGFSFEEKNWRVFDVSKLFPVDFAKNAWESVVLEDKRKKIIRSLINQHCQSFQYNDIIPGKGQGLIGLFAGGPGCGKTLTVEAVAEDSQKPLYMVSAGELGLEAADIDRRLSRIMNISQRWKAIILLDEADVFLQHRNQLDLKRHSIVSIFLRRLEYFKGIMILTTNRVDDCDPAFESRIHFSLFFNELEFDARKSIWKLMLLKAVSETTPDGGSPEQVRQSDEVSQVSFTATSERLLTDEAHLDLLAAHQLNGRQIQNAVRTATVLARSGNEPLGLAHLKMILEVGSAWSASRLDVIDMAPGKEKSTLTSVYQKLRAAATRSSTRTIPAAKGKPDDGIPTSTTKKPKTEAPTKILVSATSAPPGFRKRSNGKYVHEIKPETGRVEYDVPPGWVATDDGYLVVDDDSD